jgi:hypothetical protein
MKILTLQSLIFPVLFIFLLLSCEGNTERGNGEIVTINNGVEEFNEIKVRGNFDILLVKADTPGISITTDENLHKFINIDQSRNSLKIKSEKNLISDHGLKITVAYQDLSKIELGGASILRNKGVFTGKELSLDMAGAGAVKMQVEVKQVKMNISGAGSVEISGKAQQQAVNLNGAGGLDAKNLATEYTKISISGVGGAHVNVSNKLDASVSGVGGITYSGNPKEIKRDISGLGSIKEK